jgi:hypothetical protein
MKLDDEEKEILDAYESGRLELRAPTPEELAAIKAAAEETTNGRLPRGHARPGR